MIVDAPNPQHRAVGDWFWTQTPNPAEMILSVVVSSQLMTPTNKPHRERLALGSITYLAPTKFSELDPLFALPNLNHLGVADWQFIGENIGSTETIFYFFVNKTPAEMEVPYDTAEDVGDHPWPMVVLDVWVESDYNFPISANVVEGNDTGVITGPTNTIHDNILPPVEEGTRFITRKFLSATRPNIPYHKIPQPGAMHVQVNGASKEYPESIHDDIYLTPTRSGTKMYLTGAAVGSNIGGSTSAQFFPATNFIARKPYFPKDKPVRNQYGLWEREQVQVIAPKTLVETR